MKNKLPLLVSTFTIFSIIILIVVADASIRGPVEIFRKEAVFGELSLGGMYFDDGRTILKEKLYEPLYLDLESTSEAKTLSELGISIDEEKLKDLKKTCPSAIFRILCTNKTENPKPEDIFTIDTQKLDPFLDSLESNLQFMVGNTIISFDDYSFRPLSENARITIDRENLYSKTKLAELIGKERFSISLKVEQEDSKEEQRAAAESLVENMSYPLLIKYGRNPIYIPGDKISEFINVKERNGFVYGFVLSNPIRAYLDDISEDYASDDVRIIPDESVDAIRRALLYRASDYGINNAVILPLEGISKTNGSLGGTYLEVVKSQQRLYRFEDGKLVKKYVISTGILAETPSGEFEVLGKQKMTISYRDYWYMPNYLPIGDIDGYRFGFHEIPYHMDGAGNIYSRDPNTMGSPATSGCIQLNREDSLELFEWAEIGTPVYIYE